MSNGRRALLFACAIAMLILLAWWLPLGAWLTAGAEWIQGHGAVAWAVFILTYIIATIVVVPGTLLTLAAGLLFGLPLGVVLVSLGSVTGAACAFLIGRFLARDWLAERIAVRPGFHALDTATRHEGFIIVLLTRLSPLFPFNLLNYGLGLTSVRFRDYFFASWIGMLPGTIVYVYIGSLAASLAELAGGDVDGGIATQALLAGGLVATVLLTAIITRKATRTLREHLQQAEAAEAPPVSHRAPAGKGAGTE
jgi:uncharacterized membrane protein YdjX (TVP38/TMEM64 family)